MANTSAPISLDRRHHVTHRAQRADGQWETKCSCGWVSAPAPAREALGWACVPFEAALTTYAYIAGLGNASCPDEAYNNLNAKAAWVRGKQERLNQAVAQ